MAEGIFKKMLLEDGLSQKISCDSAGTSTYHIGEPPDTRMQQKANEHGVKLVHSARQFTAYDFDEFQYILAMDQSNHYDIQSLEMDEIGDYQILMMREFDDQAESLDVPDPYYGGEAGFENNYQLLFRSCRNFLDHLKKEHNL